MRILLFIDSNIKTIPYEIPLKEMQQQGYEIYFLSILDYGPIHEEYIRYGFKVFSMNALYITLKHLPKYLFKYQQFCNRHKIEVVFAHLPIPSLIGVLNRFLVKAKIVCFRHHYLYGDLLQKNDLPENKVDKYIDWIIGKGTKNLVVPNNSLRILINRYEGIPLQKMSVIPYAYDWSSFRQQALTSAFVKPEASLNLLMVSRLTPYKRPLLSFEVVERLNELGIKTSLTVLGVGSMTEDLKLWVAAKGLSELIIFKGFQADVKPYLLASDFLVHPSLTEASSSIIKEAGVMKLPVILCDGVGDFNDYIENGVNGWRVNPNHFFEEASQIILHTSKDRRREIGAALCETVLHKFSLSDSVVNSYKKLTIS